MTQAEVAAYVQNSLRAKGIEVVLSGGAAVAIYCANRYVSADIDLVNIHSIDRKRIRAAMEEIGFHEVARYFRHPQSSHIVEFPAGPLAIDEQPVRDVAALKLATGTLRVISPTDCVRDRLAAYYFWDDQPSLHQAVLVARHKRVNLAEIRRWSTQLNMTAKYRVFTQRLSTKAPNAKSST